MRIFLGLILAVMGGTSVSADIDSSSGRIGVEKLVGGLTEPWAIGFLPGGGALITERGGRLLHRATDGTMTELRHGLELAVIGQGGLLDVMIPRDFPTSRDVFLSFSIPQGSPTQAGTALAVGRLNEVGDRLEDMRLLFQMAPGTLGGRHFGSRIAESADGRLFLTIGERGDRPEAQNLDSHNGTVVRLNRDGSVPDDNPFVGVPGARPEIYSYGHRNPQGAAVDAQGQLWAVEHGAKGGDEINRVAPGANYGWPVISYGRHYSGAVIGEGTAREGMQQPEFYWDPSIAPSGMMIYSGKLWPDWAGDFFVGSLKFDYIARLDGTPLHETEQLQSDETIRVRDIREAPDGSIWFLSVGQGALYRMTPG
ncbi:MAG: PQQ-dependent sugar dehydrogenase [Rhodobacter sp.]|nr:PQQ-dependent sugar dehydrogenase [Rhodobacter sp.]